MESFIELAYFQKEKLQSKLVHVVKDLTWIE